MCGPAAADLGSVYDPTWSSHHADDAVTAAVGTPSATAAFTVNNAAPVASVVTPVGVQSGDVAIGYTLTDAASDPCNILAEYSPDGGATWYAATENTTAVGDDGTTRG